MSEPSRYTRLLLPWVRVIRFSFPHFKVIRRPLVFSGVTYDIGDVLPPSVSRHRVRMRQFYERRLIAPVEMSVLVQSVDNSTGERKEVSRAALLVELDEEAGDILIGDDPSLGALPFDTPVIDLEDDGDTPTLEDAIDPATIPPPPPIYQGANKPLNARVSGRADKKAQR